MSQLTAEQLTTLSGQFTNLGNAILNYRMANTLTDTQDQDLEQLQNQLLAGATQMATQSAIIAGTEASGVIDQLNKVTSHVSQTIAQLVEVQKVIDIAAASLKVVTSVISMNPQNIISSAEGLASVCSK
jgi:hypothetical protein